MSALFEWLNSSEAALGVIIAILGGAVSAWFSWHQRNLAQRERAANLFDGFYSAENYHAVVAPVFVVMLRWHALPPPQRAALASALCKGWTGYDRAHLLVAAYEPDHPNQVDHGAVDAFVESHFHKPRSTEEVTEHAALTAFLYFWVKLEAMIDAGLVSKKLARRLFAGPYDIYAQFIANFRHAVLRCPDTGDVRPVWIDATEKLEVLLLGRTLSPEPIDWSLVSGGDAPGEVGNRESRRPTTP